MTAPSFFPSLDFEHLHTGKIVAGMDEAGCGPWAGPVFTAAVILPEQLPNYLNRINDSKKLTKERRQELFNLLMADDSIIKSIGSATSQEIDMLGLKHALPLAFKRASQGLSVQPDVLLIDGIRDPKIGIETQLIVRGDQQSYSIAAASILAKVARDHVMNELHVLHPEYGWATNAGYGTAQHQAAIREYGITVHHRKSYAPIRKFMSVLNH